MVIKDKFILLKDIPNQLNLSKSAIKSFTVSDGAETIKSILLLMEKRINHFTKDYVYKELKKKKDFFVVVNIPKYPLAVSYNKPTKQIIINLNTFNTKEITPTNPTPRDLYSCLVYGLCFRDLVTKKVKIQEMYAQVIVSYLLSVFIRVFGKEYGLLGIYQNKIVKMKFILSCYVYKSFFGTSDNDMIKKSGAATGYNYSDDKEILSKLKFDDVDGLITAFSEMKVMPDLSKYNFASKVMRFLSISFMPAVEDISRFCSVILASNVPGITFIPAFFYRYNEVEFNNILEITRKIFR